MKYPFVLFYRPNQYCSMDYFFIQHAAHLQCTLYIADSPQHLNAIHNSSQYHLLITFDNEKPLISDHLESRRIHLLPGSHLLQDIRLFNEFVNVFYIRICSLERSLVRPIFSLFTPSFQSYHKILRVYKSLLAQTLTDWEWIIIDDSPDDKHFQYLRTQLGAEPRVRMYRRAFNSGSIGNVKNETIGLCRGQYVLEMDHDDELMPSVLQESANIFLENPSVGFIYYDCACVYENGENQWYGDFICKGYGGYYSQKCAKEDKWLLIYITPNINNITMSHLVCCPNHPRIWRKSILMDMGSYNEYLPICDDYEILLRTAASTQMAKVHKLGYIQYMNDSNNNFSLIRNKEINRIGPKYISPIYNEIFKIDEIMDQQGAFEDISYKINHSKIWERGDSYQHKYCNLIVQPDYDKQYCIIGLDSLFYYLDKMRELYNNTRNDFLVLDNKVPLQCIQRQLETLGFHRMKCYSLIDTPVPHLIQFFKRLYLSAPEFAILNMGIQRPPYNCEFTERSNSINKWIQKSSVYLEIGVEYGHTFRQIMCADKTGVDPSPLCGNDLPIIRKTSDNFFATNLRQFDVIFIDGMHQAEYVWRDICNASKCLNPGGWILVDDLFPLHYNEQLAIPQKHHYDDGVLKYDEPWTGDVWKAIYHLLMKYSESICHFHYYYHSNYRGVAAFQMNENGALENGNEDFPYDYFNDFADYVELMQKINANSHNLKII
jgi:glycosyltransferase involved in cell wall biosynthesis